MKNYLFIAILFGLVGLFFPEVGLAATCGRFSQDLQSLGASNSNLPGFFSSYQYCSIGSVVTKVLNTLFAFAGTTSLLFVIIGGYQYMTASGDQEKATKGRRTLTWSVIGLAVIVMSSVIVNLVSSAVLGGTGGTTSSTSGATGGTVNNTQTNTRTGNSDTQNNNGNQLTNTENQNSVGSRGVEANNTANTAGNPSNTISTEKSEALKNTVYRYEQNVRYTGGERSTSLTVGVEASPKSLSVFCGQDSSVFPVQINVGSKVYRSNFTITSAELRKLNESVTSKFTFNLTSELPAYLKVNLCGVQLTEGPTKVE